MFIALLLLCYKYYVDVKIWIHLNLKKEHIYLVKRKAEEEQMFCMVDKHSEDMQLHGVEVVKLMRVAACACKVILRGDLLCLWWLRYWRVFWTLEIV